MTAIIKPHPLTLAVARATSPHLFDRPVITTKPIRPLTPEREPRYSFVAQELPIKEPAAMSRAKPKSILRAPYLDQAMELDYCVHVWANQRGPGVCALLVRNEDHLLTLTDVLDLGPTSLDLTKHPFITAPTVIEAYLMLEEFLSEHLGSPEDLKGETFTQSMEAVEQALLRLDSSLPLETFDKEHVA